MYFVGLAYEYERDPNAVVEINPATGDADMASESFLDSNSAPSSRRRRAKVVRVEDDDEDDDDDGDDGDDGFVVTAGLDQQVFFWTARGGFVGKFGPFIWEVDGSFSCRSF